jgi:hypothetical protein
MKQRIPELLIGFLLAIALCAIGLVFVPSLLPDGAHLTGHEAADERVARYTWWLAILTFGLVLVSGFQGFFLIRADRTARMSADAAQAQTRNFTKLERPYIYVYNADGLFLDAECEDPYHFLKYAVANYGKTPATIDGVFVGMTVGTMPEPPQRRLGWHPLNVAPIMIPNETRVGLVEAIPDPIAIGEYADENTPPIPVPDLADDQDFFFQVLIKYHGPFSTGHETSVCWRWYMPSQRFEPYENEEFSLMV